MFLKLNHQSLDVYQISKRFAFCCYAFTKQLPNDEKFGMISQIRRAALSVHLNIAEGCSRKSDVERNRFYEIARGSINEIDAALDVASDLDYLNGFDATELGETMVRTYRMICRMIKPKHQTNYHSMHLNATSTLLVPYYLSTKSPIIHD